MALATPDGTCDVLIPRDRYHPFEVLAVVKEWERGRQAVQAAEAVG